MSDKKRILLESINENMNINEMPDCEIKYQKILSECKAGSLYTDKDFTADDKSLGPGVV